MRRGRQEPTFERVGIYDHSDGPDAVSLFEGYGVRFIPAQSYEMELYLAKNELGESEAITIGLSRPRQNGKSFAARYYALWCAFVEGKSVLYSAHNGSTTRKMFKFMCDFIEGHGDFHRKLKPSGQGVYKAQGSEGIFLADGTVIEFSTRTNSGARGGTYDVIVVDEAQELTDEQRDAMMPTTIAAGHTRYKAALSLGMETVPVLYASDLTPEQVAAFRLADNRVGELAQWDEERLAAELDGIGSIDMEQFGFDPSEWPDYDGIGGDADELPDASIEEIDLDEAASEAEHVYWSFSGGRDSTLALMATYKTFERQGKTCKVLYVDGGCEFPDVEAHVRRVCRSLGADLAVIRPDCNFLTEYVDRGRFPSPVFMDCVEKLVNRPIDEYIKGEIGDAPYILVRGGKASQKTSRSNTARLQRVKGKPNMTIYNPAYDYDAKQLEVDVPMWRGYEEGFDRTACWCCPFQKKKQWDALKRCYPLLWEELRSIFETTAFPLIDGDHHPKYVREYWEDEIGIKCAWC